MPADLSLRIASHQFLGASHFLLTLAPQEGRTGLGRWEPGQFVMITVGQPAGCADPLLRRPFSIFNLPGAGAVEGDVVDIFYKVSGRGTALLAQARPGDTIRCLGPLGNGFAPDRPPGSRLLLVAGGIGSASLHPLALKERRDGGTPLVLYGCRTAADLAGIAPTRDAGIECRVATDDGSAGARGLVSELLEEFLAAEGDSARERWVICACGPTPMMKATAAVAARRGVRCYVSLESPMACGFGVCVGCVVPTREASSAPLAYRRICVEGPVLDAARVIW
jgi:dihydroorotate dehydrogenase electron transfer subunit